MGRDLNKLALELKGKDLEDAISHALSVFEECIEEWFQCQTNAQGYCREIEETFPVVMDQYNKAIEASNQYHSYQNIFDRITNTKKVNSIKRNRKAEC